jgi:hypothetical protein
MALQVKPKLAAIHENELYIVLRKTPVPFTDTRGTSPATREENITYFYVFIPRECAGQAEACITALQAEGAY